MTAKRRPTPLGCFIGACLVGLIVSLLIAIALFSQQMRLDETRSIIATELSWNREDIEKQMATQSAVFKATTASLSATISYLELKQQNLAATATAHSNP